MDPTHKFYENEVKFWTLIGNTHELILNMKKKLMKNVLNKTKPRS